MIPLCIAEASEGAGAQVQTSWGCPTVRWIVCQAVDDVRDK
jgi:hypothetical protein